ncbi:hypothetical protein ALC57_16683, partial [Trachymyrmex cornetzi]
EERVCEQRKLRGFDAPFLSVNGTVIVKAARAVASLVAGEVDVIVSIAGVNEAETQYIAKHLGELRSSLRNFKLLIDLFFCFVVSSRVHEWQQMARTQEKFILRNLVESNPCVDSVSETEAVYYLPSYIKVQFVDKLLQNL